jgi:capsular exopolysaccharide synthesis family protein
MSKFHKALEQARRDRALEPKEAPAEPERLSQAPPEAVRPVAPSREAARPAEAPVAGHRWSPPAPRNQTTEPAILPLVEPLVEDVDEHLVSLVTPAGFEAEQYRSLRHTIEHLHRTDNLKVIAVSSPAIGDGKTLTAVNLAGALAQATDARVLLIDADLRRPRLAHLLGLDDTHGADLVSGILDPSITLDQIVQPRPPFNLSVICAGQTPSSPYEILKSPRFGELLEAAAKQYDYIIIDTPPLAPVQDCRVIGRWVDGFLLVVAAHRTPRRLVEEALTTLDRSKVIGIVFNQDDRPTSSQYSGYYEGDYFSDQPSQNDGARGALKRAVRRVGGSLRRQRGSSGAGARHTRGGRS